jgi:hypothetical protein
MGLLLSMLEGQLGLTDEEKAVIEPTLPWAADILAQLNAVLPDLIGFNQLYAGRAQPLVTRLLADAQVLLPNAAALLSDQFIDIGATTGAAQDAQAAVGQTYPTVTSQVTAYVNKLLPVIKKVMAEWPKIAPAVAVLEKAIARKGHTTQTFMAELSTHLQAHQHSKL